MLNTVQCDSWRTALQQPLAPRQVTGLPQVVAPAVAAAVLLLEACGRQHMTDWALMHLKYCQCTNASETACTIHGAACQHQCMRAASLHAPSDLVM